MINCKTSKIASIFILIENFDLTHNNEFPHFINTPNIQNLIKILYI
jgi:hypothetical protein